MQDIDVDLLVTQIKAELDPELENKGYKPLSDIAVKAVLTTLKALGYTVLKQDSSYISGVAEMRFNEVAAQWLLTADVDLEPNEIPGAQILQNLSKEGWTIITP